MNVDLNLLISRGLSYLRDLFEVEHEKLFTYRLPSEVEFVNLRVIAEETKEELPVKMLKKAESSEPSNFLVTGTSDLIFEGQLFEGCAIWDRSGLEHGHVIYGPCILTEMDSNTLILPGYKAEIDAMGNMLIWELEQKLSSTGVNEQLDIATVDIFESALANARAEMDALMTRTTMSPAIREQQDEFNVIAEPSGKMMVGQFGSFIGGFLEIWKETIEPGDIFLTNDPYSVAGAISHHNDWLILMPTFMEDKLSTHPGSISLGAD